MSVFLSIVAVAPLAIAAYAYVVYPVVLWGIARVAPKRVSVRQGRSWPTVTITVPVYNSESSIRSTLEHLLEVDYDRHKLQILVISDASTDRTDDIVREYSARGVELLRLPERRGKTAAENAALAASRGEILVNVDSTILVPRNSLKKLVRAFDDPTVGVASGRDISKGVGGDSTLAESRYVGYEMQVRNLETRVESIVGASGCFYGSRRAVHALPLAPGLSWDFAAALKARIQGFRSVSVPEATCIVPRAGEIRMELTRKSRTMARGLSTLFHYRELMNPFLHGTFALMLISHKLLRWLPYLLLPFAFAALCLLAADNGSARITVGFITAFLVVGYAAIRQGRTRLSLPFALAGFVVAVVSAGFFAWVTAIRQTQLATWEPTRRPEVQA